MAGVFDIKKGAFDSSEASVLHEAYAIALQGLKTTQKVDRPFKQRLASSIVKVARSEPDCLRNDGSIDPVRLAQRAILRMLQTKKPIPGIEVEPQPATPGRDVRDGEPRQESPGKIMMRLFERTRFAKL